MVDLGGELLPKPPAEGKQVHLTIEPDSPEMVRLLRTVSIQLSQLPAAITESVQRALTEQNLRRTTVVAPPDLTDLIDLVERLPQAASAEDIRSSLAGIPQAIHDAIVNAPRRRVRRTVNRDQWGRIESVTEEDE